MGLVLLVGVGFKKWCGGKVAFCGHSRLDKARAIGGPGSADPAF
ncbi:hypothetical protein [Roseinatronobacter sp. NSM]